MAGKIKKTSIFLGLLILTAVPFGALAYFDDSEAATANNCEAGSLDFSLDASGDFSLNFTSTTPSVRNIGVVNNGSLPFKYTIERATDVEGTLCHDLTLSAELDGTPYYSEELNDFLLSPAVINSGSQDDWTFRVSFAGNAATHQGQSCEFTLKFKGWQDDAVVYETAGFKDEEEVFNRVSLRTDGFDVSVPSVVLNEFLPHPSGDNENLLRGLDGEWVEIYNNGAAQADLTGWTVRDDGGTNYVIPIMASTTMAHSTIIGAKGSGDEWMVVFMNDAILNNSGDTVKLFDNNNVEIDSYTYTGAVPENKSYARIPDGTGAWVDPIPTPGRPNVAEEAAETEEEANCPLTEETETTTPFLEIETETGEESNDDAAGDIGSTQTTTDEIIEEDETEESGDEETATTTEETEDESEDATDETADLPDEESEDDGNSAEEPTEENEPVDVPDEIESTEETTEAVEETNNAPLEAIEPPSAVDVPVSSGEASV